ncbi:MAG TPA: hypothetical protein VFB90_03965 [Dehalococcoidia bacterium]|nr:hypothetical protein [Dehalococcoidia bacterium]
MPEPKPAAVAPLEGRVPDFMVDPFLSWNLDLIALLRDGDSAMPVENGLGVTCHASHHVLPLDVVAPRLAAGGLIHPSVGLGGKRWPTS